MHDIKIINAIDYGIGFLEREFIPEGQNEYFQRNSQVSNSQKAWRRLKAFELEILVKNNNTCPDWDDFYVSELFHPELIKNSTFAGLIRIGELNSVALEHNDFRAFAGITNSTIVSCDIGDNCAIHDCSYIAHYIIGNFSILTNNHAIHVSNHAKFGNGTVLQGENEDVRVWIDVMNEAGGRSILPFNGITTADAYLWATRRDNPKLLEKLKTITQNQFNEGRGKYGQIGSYSVLRSNHVIKDVIIGEYAYIKGSNKLKNLTINSSKAESTQIGEGVELVNGIIGYGCHIFYGSKAVRFVLGNNSNLKYGARLIHSFLGDNSTVSCCELLNNLIFPAHEQHHNNSFLIASLISGQSNIAAGATIGSNHNSRANDGEIRAGRGFWPGLCVTLKHYSKFASYVMIAKGDYNFELNIPFPFSLVTQDIQKNTLEIMPAYFWMYNMYALMRAPYKFLSRDRRKTKVQHIEFEILAPDTVEEILEARRLLAILTSKAQQKKLENNKSLSIKDHEINGHKILSSNDSSLKDIVLHAEQIENSARDNIILKGAKAYAAYGEMLIFYAIKNIITIAARKNLEETKFWIQEPPVHLRVWENVGGQIIEEITLNQVISSIQDGTLTNWNDIHAEWDRIKREYPLDKLDHAKAVYLELKGLKQLTIPVLQDAMNEFISICEIIKREIKHTRQKDYDNPFRKITYRSKEEMEAVLGRLEDNSFINDFTIELDKLIKDGTSFIKELL